MLSAAGDGVCCLLQEMVYVVCCRRWRMLSAAGDGMCCLHAKDCALVLWSAVGDKECALVLWGAVEGLLVCC